MMIGWGVASNEELALITREDADEYEVAGDLKDGEVAVVSQDAGIFGTEGQLVEMAKRILRKWDSGSLRA